MNVIRILMHVDLGPFAPTHSVGYSVHVRRATKEIPINKVASTPTNALDLLAEEMLSVQTWMEASDAHVQMDSKAILYLIVKVRFFTQTILIINSSKFI